MSTRSSSKGFSEVVKSLHGHFIALLKNTPSICAVAEVLNMGEVFEEGSMLEGMADAEHCSDCSIFIFSARCSEHLNVCSEHLHAFRVPSTWYPVPGSRYLPTSYLVSGARYLVPGT